MVGHTQFNVRPAERIFRITHNRPADKGPYLSLKFNQIHSVGAYDVGTKIQSHDSLFNTAFIHEKNYRCILPFFFPNLAAKYHAVHSGKLGVNQQGIENTGAYLFPISLAILSLPDDVTKRDEIIMYGL